MGLETYEKARSWVANQIGEFRSEQLRKSPTKDGVKPMDLNKLDDESKEEEDWSGWQDDDGWDSDSTIPLGDVRKKKEWLLYKGPCH